MQAIILDILRFSLQDGPGIRTTVFTKGCPLHCVWCHNPESHKMMSELSFCEERCVHCEACSKICEKGVHSWVYEENIYGKKHLLDRKKCSSCGKCSEICPNEALEIKGHWMDPEEVFSEVKKDKRYYQAEGGLTVSGGEPLLYPEFVMELFRLSKREGITTALETCGGVDTQIMKNVLPLTDYLLLDYKLDTQMEYEKYTGGKFELIHKNLKLAFLNHQHILLRCPIIPGINDTKNHFCKIAELSNETNVQKVTLMPYHNMGRKKWEQMGMHPVCEEEQLQNLATVETEQKERWIQQIESYGGRNIC